MSLLWKCIYFHKSACCFLLKKILFDGHLDVMREVDFISK